MTFRFDHAVVACGNLGESADQLADLFGVAPTFGGRHRHLGTANYLFGIDVAGSDGYLELIGPDPDNSAGQRPDIFGLRSATDPRVATWAARGDQLDQPRLEQIRRRGWDPGEASERQREGPDGTVRTWTMTDARLDRLSSVVPFLLAWTSPRPSLELTSAITLVELRLRHPEPDRLRAAVEAIGVATTGWPLTVEPGAADITIIAAGPAGQVRLDRTGIRRD